MDSLSIIISLIIVCLALIFLLVMVRPIKFFFGILVNAALGAGGIYVANMLMAPFGIVLGINLLTVGFIGILGLPGFCALLLISALM